jgi:hypothetical protein
MNDELSFLMTMPPGSCEGVGVAVGVGVGVGVGVAVEISMSTRTSALFTTYVREDVWPLKAAVTI